MSNVPILIFLQRGPKMVVELENHDHFGLKKCLQPPKALVYYKKWVNTLHASYWTSTLVLHTMDVITITAIQIEESMKDALSSVLLLP